MMIATFCIHLAMLVLSMMLFPCTSYAQGRSHGYLAIGAGAMVQALIQQVIYQDPVVYDWAHIKAPTLAFGRAEDSLAADFRGRMKFVADTIPNGNGRLHLIPGLGHVPHMEAPDKFYPPVVAFLKEGLPASASPTGSRR